MTAHTRTHIHTHTPTHTHTYITAANFALLEARTLLCNILRDYRFEVVAGHEVEMVTSVVRKAIHDIKVTVHARKAATIRTEIKRTKKKTKHS